MFFDINKLSRETSSLRAALKRFSRPANELSHVECQQVLAHAAGFPTLHACKAHLARPRFVERHSPYLTGDPAELVDLVQRVATRQETTSLTGDTPKSLISTYLESARRMGDQLTAIRSGELRVAPALAAAFETAASLPLDTLHREELTCLLHFKKTLRNHHGGEGTDEAYDAAYAAWRLASLARCYRLSDELPPQNKLASLFRSTDFYRLVAVLAKAGAAGLNDLSPEAPHNPWADSIGQAMVDVAGKDDVTTDADVQTEVYRDGRQLGKAVTLQLLSGARLNENYFQGIYGVRAPANLDNVEALFHAQFPEVRLWHIWLELKPVFAPDADAYWAKRH